jgi:hypothetical protein
MVSGTATTMRIHQSLVTVIVFDAVETPMNDVEKMLVTAVRGRYLQKLAPHLVDMESKAAYIKPTIVNTFIALASWVFFSAKTCILWFKIRMCSFSSRDSFPSC